MCVRILSLLLLLQPPPTKYYHPPSLSPSERRRITMDSASSIRTCVKGGGVSGWYGWVDGCMVVVFVV